jgi:molybdopterin molybdotransferase
MHTVSQAVSIITAQKLNNNKEFCQLENANGRVLAENIVADRPFPPFDRVTMDGIAISFDSYSKGNRQFEIETTQYAGQAVKTLSNTNACIEVMTGAMLPQGCNTVIRYEDLEINNRTAILKVENILIGQNIHTKGEDKKQAEILIHAGTKINAPQMAILATVGCIYVPVSKLPKVAIVSSGDELVPVDNTPKPYQIRISNSYAIGALVQQLNIKTDSYHLPDKVLASQLLINKLLEEYDLIILSGGVSMGKKDFLPKALEAAGVQQLFHKIAQKPGKPMWCGRTKNQLVFALPGNPVSGFLCMIRYVLPWLRQHVGWPAKAPKHAILSQNIATPTAMCYFAQVNLTYTNGQYIAAPILGHGSGDFTNLLAVNAFAELAPKQGGYLAGDKVLCWQF